MGLQASKLERDEAPRRKQRGIFLTDGLTRRLLYFRPKGRGINPTRLNFSCLLSCLSPPYKKPIVIILSAEKDLPSYLQE